MSFRSMGVMKVLCKASTTACVISSHSCSICLIRSALASRSWGCSTISWKARQPSTVFFPCCSKNSKKDTSCGKSLIASVYTRSEGNGEAQQDLVLVSAGGDQGLDVLG